MLGMRDDCRDVDLQNAGLFDHVSSQCTIRKVTSSLLPCSTVFPSLFDKLTRGLVL